MDDANVPVGNKGKINSVYANNPLFTQSLLSLPYLGFLDKSHPAYVATRKLLLSAKNPYFSAGKKFRGIGCVNAESIVPVRKMC